MAQYDAVVRVSLRSVWTGSSGLLCSGLWPSRLGYRAYGSDSEHTGQMAIVLDAGIYERHNYFVIQRRLQSHSPQGDRVDLWSVD